MIRQNFIPQNLLRFWIRFLKQYNIPLTSTTFSKLLTWYGSNRVPVDVLVSLYIGIYNIDNNNGITDDKKHILDYLWCSFIYEHYKEVNQSNKWNKIYLCPKEYLGNIVETLKGKIIYENLTSFQKQEYPTLDIFLFDIK